MNRTELKNLFPFVQFHIILCYSIILMNFSCTYCVNYGLFSSTLNINFNIHFCFFFKFFFCKFFLSSLINNFFFFFFVIKHCNAELKTLIFDIKQHFPFKFVPFLLYSFFSVSQKFFFIFLFFFCKDFLFLLQEKIEHQIFVFFILRNNFFFIYFEL